MRRSFCRATSLAALLTASGAGAQPVAPERPAPAEPSLPAERAPGLHPDVPTVSLRRALAIALENNFGTLAASDAVLSARRREGAVRAQFLPQLTPRFERSSDAHTLALEAGQRLPWTGGRLTVSGSLHAFSPQHSALPRSSDVRLLLTQPLLRGFGPNATGFDVVNSRRAREAQERALVASRQRLAVQVASAFYQVLQQRQLLHVSRQSLRRSQNLQTASEARLAVGLVSKLDVFRAQLQAAQAEEAVVRAESSLQGALEQLRYLMGLAPTEAVEPEDLTLPEPAPADSEDVAALVAEALRGRVELQEARDQVADARRSLSLARQNLLPQLDLNLGFTQAGFGTDFRSALATDRRWTFSFSTAYPLERGADRAGRAVATIEERARERGLRQRELEVEAEVRQAVRERARIRKSVDLQRRAVDVAEQQHQLATLRYQRGLASNFDVVDAEANLVIARSALVTLLGSYQVAGLELQRATGRLDPEVEAEQ